MVVAKDDNIYTDTPMAVGKNEDKVFFDNSVVPLFEELRKMEATVKDPKFVDLMTIALQKLTNVLEVSVKPNDTNDDANRVAKGVAIVVNDAKKIKGQECWKTTSETPQYVWVTKHTTTEHLHPQRCHQHEYQVESQGIIKKLFIYFTELNIFKFYHFTLLAQYAALILPLIMFLWCLALNAARRYFFFCSRMRMFACASNAVLSKVYCFYVARIIFGYNNVRVCVDVWRCLGFVVARNTGIFKPTVFMLGWLCHLFTFTRF